MKGSQIMDREASTRYCGGVGVAQVQDRGVADIGRRIYAYRPRSALAYGHDVRELGIGEPGVLLHRLVLNEREHGITPAEIEYAYLGEDQE